MWMNGKIKSFWNNIMLLQKPEDTSIYLSILKYIDFLNFVKGCYEQLLKTFKSTIFVMLNLFQHLRVLIVFKILKQNEMPKQPVKQVQPRVWYKIVMGHFSVRGSGCVFFIGFYEIGWRFI